MVSSRNWAGNLGVGVEKFLEVAPHKVGDVSPVRVEHTVVKKHIAVVRDWLLLLLLLLLDKSFNTHDFFR